MLMLMVIHEAYVKQQQQQQQQKGKLSGIRDSHCIPFLPELSGSTVQKRLEIGIGG